MYLFWVFGENSKTSTYINMALAIYQSCTIKIMRMNQKFNERFAFNLLIFKTFSLAVF